MKFDTSSIGGKAAGIRRLKAAGLSVPETVEVSAEEALPLRRELAEAVAALGPGPYIVRSSADAEDSEAAAHAGIMDTIHDVKSVDDVSTAVQSVRSSATSQRAKAYGEISGQVVRDAHAIVQLEYQPEWAGVLFTSPPTSAHRDATVLYAEWVWGHGKDLVDGGEAAGRCWLDNNGTPLRIDHQDGSPAPDITILSSAVPDLLRLRSEGGGELDFEFLVAEGQLVWVQCRPITSRRPSDAVVPDWLLPGVPERGRAEEIRSAEVFDFWDEYNRPAIAPLHFDGYMESIWQSSVESVGSHFPLVPSIADFVVRVNEVPVAIEPTAKSTVAPRQASLDDLKRISELARLESRAILRKLEDDRLDLGVIELFEHWTAMADLYREVSGTRLLAMGHWIESIDRCEQDLRNLSTGSAESLVERLLQSVDHQTRQFRRAAGALAAADLGSHDPWQRFLTEYGHFRLGDSWLYFTEDRDVLGEIAGSIDETPKQTLEEIAEQHDVPETSLSRFKDVAAELKTSFEVRESSKTDQDVPGLVLEVIERRLAEKLGKDLEDLAMLTPEELAACLEGSLEWPEDEVADRREVFRWKAQRSWAPGWYTGEVRLEPLSEGQAEGRIVHVHGPSDFAKVEEGDIVVASRTNPAWTVLFGRIAGLVVEHASRLSHAAITSREFGLPALGGAVGAFETLAEGQTVRISAERGTCGIDIYDVESGRWNPYRP